MYNEYGEVVGNMHRDSVIAHAEHQAKGRKVIAFLVDLLPKKYALRLIYIINKRK